ncbi:MAG TPA: lanthionine synthetase C family protein [Myxococcales bacterium]
MGEWRPILAGAIRQRAIEALSRIAADLREPVAGQPFETAMRALLHAGLRAGGLCDDDAIAGRLVSAALDATSACELTPWTQDGFCGVAWALDCASRLDPELLVEEEHPEVDAALEALVRNRAIRPELLYGLAGVGLYCVERARLAPAREIVEEIVCRLEECSAQDAEGRFWPVLQAMPVSRREAWQVNLGVAHGMPGIIAFLAAVQGGPAANARAGRLLSGAVRWLLAQRRDGASFPDLVPLDGAAPLRATRTTWCYGDGGIAPVLLNAGAIAGNERWKREAMEVAIDAAGRQGRRAGIVDPGLCHGAAGLAQIFTRLSCDRTDPRFEGAAVRWIEDALDRELAGTGKFASWTRAAAGAEPAPEVDTSFLTGSTGIGLCLLSAAAPVEPAWDRMLGMSVAPREGRPA